MLQMENTKNLISKLKIGHFNINGIVGNLNELKEFIYFHKIDIMLLNETKLSINKVIKVPGFVSVRKDRNDKGTGGGVMILIKSKIEFHEIPINTENIEAVGIKLPDSTVIISGYKPPQGRIDEKELQNIFNSGDKVLLYGDFNAKNTMWNCRRDNASGKALLNFTLKHSYKILCPNSYTLYPYSNAAPNTVDIGFNKNLKCDISIDVLNELNSDHRPVLIVLDELANIETSEQSFFSYKKANWDKYRKIVNKNLILDRKIISQTDVDRAVDELVIVIQKASLEAIPKDKIKRNFQFISNEIKGMIKTRNKLRKICQRTNKQEYKNLKNRLSNLIKRKIAIFSNENWDRKLDKLEVKDNSLWKMAKCLTKRKETEIPVLHDLNGLALSNEDRVAQIADNFEKVHHLTGDMGDYDNDRLIHKVYNEIQKKTIDKDQIEPTNPKEIRKVIKRTKPKKAPGLDNIQNILLKNLPKKGIVQLNYIFNACFLLSYFPSNWKRASILPIHKTGKDKLFPQSYRPINLLPTLSKIYEKIILNRIKNHENKHQYLIPEQFGFREQRNTVQQLYRVSNHISTNFNLNKATALALLDIEKAFDTVWHEGLIHKLANYNFPIYILKILQSYLENRTFIVKANKVSSTERLIAAGVPQGSILGPVLFIYFLNDIPKSAQVKLSLFADDTALYVSSWRIRLAVGKLQSYLNILLEYFQLWKLKINIDKTEFIVFNVKKRKELVPKLAMNNIEIQPKTEAKYLGKILDHNLNHSKHIQSIKRKAYGVIGMLHCLIGRRSKLRVKNKLILYKAIVRPIIMYAAPVWSNTCKTNVNTLQIIQNRCLRLILKSSPKEKSKELHNKCKVQLVRDYIYELAKKFYVNQIEISEAMQELTNELIIYKTKSDMPFKCKHSMPYQLLIKET